MAIPGIQNLTMSNVRAEFEGGFARQNQYQVFIENGWGGSPVSGSSRVPFLDHLNNSSLKQIYGFTWDTTMKRLLSFSCANATLPSSTYATGEVKDNFQGVTEEFAHTRINTDIDFSFYVDRDYKVLMFFEAWINFISGGNSYELMEPSAYTDQDTYSSQNPINGYYRRFQYPKHYKNESGFFIRKFEKNHGTPEATDITYQLINSFPKNITTTPLQYGEAEVMRVTVSMNYDRYRIYRKTSTADTSAPLLGDSTLGANDLPGNITSTSPIG